jgi:hypothetical protein
LGTSLAPDSATFSEFGGIMESIEGQIVAALPFWEFEFESITAGGKRS